MIQRYNSNNLEIWHKNIADVDYIFMVFDSNQDFNNTVSNWNEESTPHPFENWFKEQVEKMYAANPLETAATPMLAVQA